VYARQGITAGDEWDPGPAGLPVEVFESVEKGLLDKERRITTAIGGSEHGGIELPPVTFSREMQSFWRIGELLHECGFLGEEEELLTCVHELHGSLMALALAARGTKPTAMALRSRAETVRHHIGLLLSSLQIAKDALILRCSRNGLGELMVHRHVWAKRVDWVVCFGREVVFLGDTLRGPVFIQYLLKNQGKQIHVARMLADISGDEALLNLLGPTELVDREALADVRRRYEKLQDDIRNARFGRDDVSEAAQRKLNELAGFYASAMGLHGKSRSTTDGVTRARRAIARNITTVYEKLSSYPAIEGHLRRSIETNSFMSYIPEPRVNWFFG